MRIRIILLCCFSLGWCAAPAQSDRSPENPFPSVVEFPELRGIVAEKAFNEPTHLSSVEDGRLISDVGFQKYAMRVYSTREAGDITVTVVTLMDFRAAYSLLTLRSSSSLSEGPPGDAFASGSSGIMFCQGRHWVRIAGPDSARSLLPLIADTVSQRLGSREKTPPSMIQRLPRIGYDASSLKYFPGLKSFESYSGARDFQSYRLNFDAEIAQARYSVDGQSGALTLLYFPTPEVGEEYFSELSATAPGRSRSGSTYIKRAGPLVGILRGNISPAAADKILGEINHSYTIRWIYEKPANKGIAWGIPVRILHTVAKSAFFVIFLCIVAIIAGAGGGVGFYMLQRRASRNAPEGIGSKDSKRLRLR